jgi:predicted HAD superfamily Cof-like phosphohydrolase
VDPVTEAISRHDPPRTEQQTYINPMEGVFEFHVKYGQPIGVSADPGNFDVASRFIREEIKELLAELKKVHEKVKIPDLDVDLSEVAGLCKEMADVVFVIYGFALTYDLPFDRIFSEVVRSNLTKEGTKKNGKVQKGESYKPPEVDKILLDHHNKKKQTKKS